MQALGAMGTAFKAFLDTFGVTVLVPLVIFLLSLILRVEVKKAFRAAIYMAIGLTAFNLILGILWGQMDSIMSMISANIGRTFDIVDIGWPAAAAIVYANTLGYAYFIIGLVFQVVLFAVKYTDTFEPTDIWNYYYFVVWGLLVQFATGSIFWALITIMVNNLLVLLVGDALAPALQEYYGYEGLTNTCICTVNIALFSGVILLLWKKLKIKDVHVSPESIQQKFGFLGEPAMIGVIMGILMGIVAYIKVLGSMATWSSILSFCFTLAAMLVIYPTVSGMFVKGLIPITQTLNARMRSGQMKRQFFNLGIDPAVFFGETATVTTGLLLIPSLVLTSLLPGNRIIPLADIPAMPFMAIGAIAVFQGDIFKATVTGTIWYTICHYLCSDTAHLFTQAAINAGQELAEGQTHVISWCVGSNPFYWALYKFTSAGSTGVRAIGVIIFLVLYVGGELHFKKHRKAWYSFLGASDEYIEKFMHVNDEAVANA